MKISKISQGPEQFSVASYNIHRCVGLDRRLDPGRISEVIKELDADVIGLQEIDSKFYKTDACDQLKYLAGSTGLNVAMAPTRRRGNGHYGNALLTRHDIKDVRRIDLSVSGREPRGAVDVDLDIAGTTVRVIVAHLGLGFSERREQIRRLKQIFCAERDHLEVMLGDFNVWIPKRRPLCLLHDYFGKPPSRLTFPSFFPVFALDRIWVRPLDTLVAMGVHSSPLSRVASDHLPVKAAISLAANIEAVADPCCEAY